MTVGAFCTDALAFGSPTAGLATRTDVEAVVAGGWTTVRAACGAICDSEGATAGLVEEKSEGTVALDCFASLPCISSVLLLVDATAANVRGLDVLLPAVLGIVDIVAALNVASDMASVRPSMLGEVARVSVVHTPLEPELVSAEPPESNLACDGACESNGRPAYWRSIAAFSRRYSSIVLAASSRLV